MIDGSEHAAERAIGRFVAVGLPVGCAVGAIAAGIAAGMGSALLVMASGTLLGTIAFCWASLRTLNGDAPLPAAFEGLSMRRADVDELGERKRRVLRALKDLDAEHAVGKIDDADYALFVRNYRDEAKTLMREMDADAAPSRLEAERVAGEYLARLGLARTQTNSAAMPPSVEMAPVVQRELERETGAKARIGAGERLVCPRCAVSNEPDAAFCKGCGAEIARERSSENAT